MKTDKLDVMKDAALIGIVMKHTKCPEELIDKYVEVAEVINNSLDHCYNPSHQEVIEYLSNKYLKEKQNESIYRRAIRYLWK